MIISFCYFQYLQFHSDLGKYSWLMADCLWNNISFIQRRNPLIKHWICGSLIQYEIKWPGSCWYTFVCPSDLSPSSRVRLRVVHKQRIRGNGVLVQLIARTVFVTLPVERELWSSVCLSVSPLAAVAQVSSQTILQKVCTRNREREEFDCWNNFRCIWMNAVACI